LRSRPVSKSPMDLTTRAVTALADALALAWQAVRRLLDIRRRTS